MLPRPISEQRVFVCTTPHTLKGKGGIQMATPASIAKHPIHPILVALPIGLWIFSLASDVMYLIGWGMVWLDVAYYSMAGGLVGALLAAVPGLMDLLSISDPKVKRIGIWHMCINLVVVALFAINLWLRTVAAAGVDPPIWLSVIGVVLIGISGWLGGEMVYVHGVAVEPRRTAAEQHMTDRTQPRRAA
jgi:uncharacterized membrane protein